MPALGDLAEKIAVDLKAEMVTPMEEETLGDEPLADSGIFAKMRFSWRREDKAILDRIRAAADAMFIELFADVVVVIDQFYASLRVPEMTPQGTNMVGPDGRWVWKLDELGKPIEDLAQLTGQDVDTAILALQKLMLEISPQVETLMLEAVMAHNIAKDIHDDAWMAVIEGTQGDRTARANRESRQDRWQSFFRYYLHRRALSFMEEVKAFQRQLENIAYRQARRQT